MIGCRLSAPALGVALLWFAAPVSAQGGEPRLAGQPVAQEIHITGGGPVLQILAGPAPFAQRALQFVPTVNWIACGA